MRVKSKFQIGDDVAHLHAFVEGEAADDIVSQPCAPQCFFKDARLSVGAIEHSGAYVRLRAAMLLNLPGDEARLRVRVVCLIIAYALACRVRCPESLALTLRVVFDDRA